MSSFFNTRCTAFAARAARRPQLWLAGALLLAALQPSASRAADESCTLAETLAACNSPLFVALAAAAKAGYTPGGSARESIAVENDFADAPTKSSIVIEQSGLADDSVAAFRFVVQLAANDVGAWKVVDVVHTWKCYPGRGSQVFGTKRCS